MAKRKLVISLFTVCLAIAAAPVAVYGSLRFQTWHFHQEHRLLREMRAVQSESTNDSTLARDALLQLIPLGTHRETVTATLSSEGFGCQAIAKPITETRLKLRFAAAHALPDLLDNGPARKSWVDCQSLAPNVIGNKHWIVDLEFDADEHLNDVGVAMWNIFL